MENNLRPLTLGEILDRTAQLYRTNFWLFAGIFAFYAGVWLVFGLLQVAVTASLKGSHALTAVTVGLTVFTVIAVFLLTGAAIAATSRAVAAVHLNQPMTIREAYASTLPKLGRYLWLTTLTYLRAWVPLTVLYAIVIGTAATMKAAAPAHAATHPAAQQNLAALGVIVVSFLLMVPAFVFGMWMHLRYSLGIPASVMENLKARDALKRSIQLSKGARGRILMMFLLVGVIKIGLTLLTQSFVFVAAFKHPNQQLSPVISILSQVAGFFTNTVLGPIGATALTLFYYDQRVRNEGYDIEWMMRAAGMAEPAGVEVPVPAGDMG